MSTTELAWFKSTYSSGGDGDCVEVALSWRKSSYSSSGDGDCVEMAASWHTSGYSSGSQGDCVEVASCPGTVHVRDSKVRYGGQLAVSPASWSHFLGYTTGTRSGFGTGR